MATKSCSVKIAAWAVTTVFLISQGGIAAPGLNLEIMPERETPSFLRIDIPPRLAEVEEIYEAPPRVDPNLVVHIQDAHGSYDAQLKVKNLLKYLYETYNFRLFFVEGAIERLDADYLRIFPDNSHNIELADRLAREGKITGAEFFLVEAPAGVEARGIEHAELYRANYDAFKQVYAGEEKAGNFFSATDMRLDTLASQIFSKDLRRIVLEWKRFEEGQRDFLPYIKSLTDEASKHLNIEMNALSSQVQWPQLTRMLLLQSMEEDIDFERGKAEKAEVVKVLYNLNVSEKIINAIKGLEENHIRMNRLSPADERMENLPRYLIERLTLEAGPKGFRFQDYPEFSLYAGYHILKSEIDSRLLFEEIEILFQQVLDKVAQTPKEKELLRLIRDCETLKKLFKLELTRDNWDSFLKRQNVLTLKNIYERIAAMDGGASRLPDEKILSVFQAAVRFYNLARQRETVFYYTINKGMISEKEEKSMLFTGGFHTAGVFERFREDEVNYGILMPRIQGEINRENYMRTMLRTHPTTFKRSTLMQPSSMLSNQALEALGFDPADFVEELVLTAVKMNLEWLKRDGHYSARSFIDTFNRRIGPARDFYLVPDHVNGLVYYYYQGRYIMNAEAPDTYKTLVLEDKENYKKEKVNVITPLEGDRVTQNPPYFDPGLYEKDSDKAAVIPGDGLTTPPEIIADIPEVPPPAAESRLERAERDGASRNEALSSFFDSLQGLLLGSHLLNKMDPEKLRFIPRGETDQRRSLAEISTYVAFGIMSPDLTLDDMRAVITGLLQTVNNGRSHTEKAREEVRNTTQGFSSEEPAYIFEARSQEFTDEEILALASDLYYNPKMHKSIIFANDDSSKRAAFNAGFLQRVDQALRKISGEKIDAEKLNISGRLHFKTKKTDEVDDAINELYQKHFHASKVPYVVLLQDDLTVAENSYKLPPYKKIIINSGISQLRDVQSYVAGAIAKKINSPAMTGEFMKAVTLNKETVDLLVYNMELEGLSVLSSQISRIVGLFKAALALESAA